MSIIAIGLVVGMVLCAIQALRAKRLLASAVWLTGVSALLSITLYLLGAHEVAVIELSVGAGLVTVLFVFAISIAGEQAINAPALIPRPLAWGLVILSVLLLGWQVLPVVSISSPFSEPSFASVLWQGRGLDVLVQIVLVFAGVLGVLGLLAEAREPAKTYAGEGAKAEARAAQPLCPTAWVSSWRLSPPSSAAWRRSSRSPTCGAKRSSAATTRWCSSSKMEATRLSVLRIT